MNSYDLSRNFWDWAFENPDKIKPIHAAIYFFAVEHCNRLGWKEKFGLPSQMVMEAIGVKNWRTYSAGLNDLVDFNFLKMVEKSKNQYSANIVAIVNFTKASTKALDKALQKHSTKQCISTVSIDKQETIEQGTNKLPFDLFWDEYDKKVGDQKVIKKKWDKLSIATQNEIMLYIPKYKKSKPDKQYRKNPSTFINQEGWKDELIGINNERSIVVDHRPPAMRNNNIAL